MYLNQYWKDERLAFSSEENKVFTQLHFTIEKSEFLISMISDHLWCIKLQALVFFSFESGSVNTLSGKTIFQELV